MFFWILFSSGLVIGFHFFLKLLGTGKGNIASSLHPIRRLQHMMTGFLIIGIYLNVSHSVAIFLVFVPTVLFIVFDVLRRKYFVWLNDWFLHHWEWLLRPHELRDKPPGAAFFLFGVLAVVLLTNDTQIVVLSVLFVSVCDPAASVFGILIGGPRITHKKSLAGTTAAGICGLVITKVVSEYFSRFLNPLYGFFIAVIAEAINVKHLDDNFTIPVISCLLWKLTFAYVL